VKQFLFIVHFSETNDYVMLQSFECGLGMKNALLFARGGAKAPHLRLGPLLCPSPIWVPRKNRKLGLISSITIIVIVFKESHSPKRNI